ncbi:MAG: hypothetical protein NC124_01880 [Clostridium sp.]|nr:hypothetical protein [Clostridium sp.]MCM1534680.1 hypothetical protein [Clostridium sp.]
MYVKVTLKQLGKKRNKFQAVPFELEHSPANVGELIRECVHTCVKEYRVRAAKVEQPMTEAEIEAQKEIGKIAFGIHYNEGKVNEQKAADTALQAYEDGLFRIFRNEEELGEAGQELHLTEADVLTLVRLTMLSGSYTSVYW